MAPATAFHGWTRCPAGARRWCTSRCRSEAFTSTPAHPSIRRLNRLSLSAATANLPPEKNKTYEFGSKWDLLQRRLSLRAAIFRTEKTNAREPDPNNPLLNVLAGNQRVNGAQMRSERAAHEPLGDLVELRYLDGKVVSSNYYPAAVGATLANVPRNTFKSGTTYRLAMAI